jgi:hypothetical protein
LRYIINGGVFMSNPVRPKSGHSEQYSGPDSLLPMRELIERQKGLRPVQHSGASNQNNLVGRDLQRLPANGEAPSEQENGPVGDVALALGAAALVTTAATYAYDWFWGSSVENPALPVNQVPAVENHADEASAVNIFLPRDADDADLEAIRLAELTARDAEIAQRIADEDARAAAEAKRLRDEQVERDAKAAQLVHNVTVAAKK